MVGVVRLERTTSRSQSVRSSQLSYTPKTLVPMVGLEPTRPSLRTTDFKSVVSTSSTTSALQSHINKFKLEIKIRET